MARWYCQQGLMVGTVFRGVLGDLRREDLIEEAQEIEGTVLLLNFTSLPKLSWSLFPH